MNIPGENRSAGKVAKGMPSAVALSILIHAALFLLAGMLVVFTVVKKEEKKFEPPKAVERPKMKLRKPKVKVKKNAKPKPTTQIVVKTTRANMPELQLPEISGMGEGLSGGIDGFDLMPDFGETTLFGSGQSVGNDFVGTFYDTKRGRGGRTLPVDPEGNAWRDLIHKFLRRGWDTSILSRYYRSPKKLYATNLVVPLAPSSVVPLAFGDKDAVGALWMVHYKGQLVHKEAITFRFWGMADEFMAVRVDGKLVLALDWPPPSFPKIIRGLWDSESADSLKYYMGDERAVVGDWITLEPGEPLDMEILIGDNGRVLCYFLAVEVEGVEYERNRQGGPILPAFKTAKLSHDLLDIIYNGLPEGEICLTNGPVFRDYGPIAKDTGTAEPSPAKPDPSPEPKPLPVEKRMRTWLLAGDRTLEAEFVNTFGGKVVLKTAQGKMHKIPKNRLSAEDLEYAELAQPPVFNINFLKTSRQMNFHGGFYDIEWWDRHPEKEVRYGIQFKQTSAGEYNHDLHVEMFVVGKQQGRARYILLDHQKTTFNPASEEQRFYEFRSPEKVVLSRFRIYGIESECGVEYASYLVTVKDARGETIAVKSPSKWLVENLENLKRLSVGNYMDKTCTRTFPSRPKTLMY